MIIWWMQMFINDHILDMNVHTWLDVGCKWSYAVIRRKTSQMFMIIHELSQTIAMFLSNYDH